MVGLEYAGVREVISRLNLDFTKRCMSPDMKASRSSDFEYGNVSSDSEYGNVNSESMMYIHEYQIFRAHQMITLNIPTDGIAQVWT